jgi:hypothetical protein
MTTSTTTATTKMIEACSSGDTAAVLSVLLGEAPADGASASSSSDGDGGGLLGTRRHLLASSQDEVAGLSPLMVAFCRSLIGRYIHHLCVPFFVGRFVRETCTPLPTHDVREAYTSYLSEYLIGRYIHTIYLSHFCREIC